MFARERPRRHAIEAGDADDLLDEISLAFDVRPPRRNLDDEAIAVAGRTAKLEAEMLKDSGHFGRFKLKPGQARHFAEEEDDSLVDFGNFAGERDIRRLAAAEIHHERGSEFKTGQQESRIDAALEAVARIRIDAEPAARPRNIDRIPERRIRSRTEVVASSQPVADPPMIPASDCAPAASAMTTISGSSA